jgi:hypothetical protein
MIAVIQGTYRISSPARVYRRRYSRLQCGDYLESYIYFGVLIYRSGKHSESIGSSFYIRTSIKSEDTQIPKQ